VAFINFQINRNENNINSIRKLYRLIHHDFPKKKHYIQQRFAEIARSGKIGKFLSPEILSWVKTVTKSA
jgi:hypothetical protein